MTVPDNCEAVRVRYVSSSTTAVEWYASPVIIVQGASSQYYGAPSWLTNPDAQILKALELPAGAAAGVADTYQGYGGRPVTSVTPRWEFGSDQWLTPDYVQFAAKNGRPVGLHVQRPYSELSADSGTTNADEDFGAYAAIARILRDQGDEREADKWEMRAAKLARARRYGRHAPKPLFSPREPVGV